MESIVKKPITNITLKDYDRALMNKLRSATKTNENGEKVIQVVYSPVNLAFINQIKHQMSTAKIGGTQETATTIKLPMISFYRPNGLSLSDMTHRVLGHKKQIFDYYYEYVADDGLTKRETRHIQNLYVNTDYQIDIWSADEDVQNELVMQLLFLLIRDPYVKIDEYSGLPDQVKKSMAEASGIDPDKFNTDKYVSLIVNDTVLDNTDLESEFEKGKLFRNTFTVSLKDAILVRDVGVTAITNVDIDIYNDSTNEGIKISIK